MYETWVGRRKEKRTTRETDPVGGWNSGCNRLRVTSRSMSKLWVRSTLGTSKRLRLTEEGVTGELCSVVYCSGDQRIFRLSEIYKRVKYGVPSELSLYRIG